MTQRRRRTSRRLVLFGIMCVMPALFAIAAHLLWLRIPNWLPALWLGCAVTIVPVACAMLEQREDERLRRSMHPLCLRCGYDLTGNETGVCPECGHHHLD